MNNEFGNSVEDLDIDLDDNDSSLMQEGPLPLPVTMSKLDAVQSLNLEVTSESVSRLANLSFLNQAHAAENCSVDEFCKVSVTGLAGAVSNPIITPYVMVYADDDTFEIGEVNSDGSFSTLSVTVPFDEELEATNHILIVRLTEAELSAAIASYPLYVQIDDKGQVLFTITNNANLFDTSLIHFDNFDNLYYSVLNTDDTWDIWRQGSNGKLPLLLADDVEFGVFDILAISDELITIFFNDGSVQSYEIEIAETAYNISKVVFKTALAESQKITRDGHNITGPNSVTSYEINSDSVMEYELEAFNQLGFIITKPPTSEVEYLAGFVPTTFDFILTLIPNGVSEDHPIHSEVTIDENYLYSWSVFFAAGERIEFSRMQIIPKDLTASSESPWSDRQVLFDNMSYRPVSLTAKNGTFVLVATNELDAFEILRWDLSLDDFVSVWNASNSQLPENLKLDAAVVVSPNGKLVFACATESYPSDDELSDTELKTLQKDRGSTILVHRLQVDEPGVFTTLVDNVNADACPSGVGINDDYFLYYYSKSTFDSNGNEISPQLSFINLYEVSRLEDLLP